MRPNAKRRKASQRYTWAQLVMGAGALLLPPLALGAAFYSMLAPDADAMRAAQAAADPQQQAILPLAPITVVGPERRPPPGDATQVPMTTAAVHPPATDGNSAAPPKRAPRRAAHQPRPDPHPLKTWLQDIGILPRNGNNTRGS